ncbi:hypothetical protein GYMLUDRAFT_245922 [Collybiopsis luxurians FD-317 M1]|uniref:Uncharacterized protein n=1 Tax=Collybiopsis luxurians FD-317 M1 TaxID=944289 RepID=A0A0D0CS90_9AGAR|nr:hypothetical protein GYMLUDRAFT_245922 [Collybiopsis luxurians FD-317 M1]
MPPQNLPLLTSDDIFLPDLHAVSYDPNDAVQWTITNNITSPKTIYRKDNAFMLKMVYHSVALAKGWNVPEIVDYLPIAATINIASPDMLKCHFTTFCEDGVTPFVGDGHITYSCLWSKDECKSEDVQLFDSNLITDAGRVYPHPNSLHRSATTSASSLDNDNMFAGYTGSNLMGIVHALVKNSTHDHKRDLAIQAHRSRNWATGDPKLSRLFCAHNAAKACCSSTPAINSTQSPSAFSSTHMET